MPGSKPAPTYPSNLSFFPFSLPDGPTVPLFSVISTFFPFPPHVVLNTQLNMHFSTSPPLETPFFSFSAIALDQTFLTVPPPLLLANNCFSFTWSGPPELYVTSFFFLCLQKLGTQLQILFPNCSPCLESEKRHLPSPSSFASAVPYFPLFFPFFLPMVLVKTKGTCFPLPFHSPFLYPRQRVVSSRCS